MGRIDIFEWEDLPWFPRLLRGYGTDFLGFGAKLTKMYQPVLPLLKDILLAVPENKRVVVDLGSGNGEAAEYLIGSLKDEVKGLKAVLTDLYPDRQRLGAVVERDPSIFSFYPDPVDACELPPSLKGVRLMVLSFHHFPPADAKKILESGVKSGEPIVIIEGQERSLKSIVSMLLSPLNLLLLTPFIRPFRLTRLVFTYLVPILPLFVLWDGVASSLRTYSEKECMSLADQVVVDEKKYSFSYYRLKKGMITLGVFIGRPSGEWGL